MITWTAGTASTAPRELHAALFAEVLPARSAAARSRSTTGGAPPPSPGEVAVEVAPAHRDQPTPGGRRPAAAELVEVTTACTARRAPPGRRPTRAPPRCIAATAAGTATTPALAPLRVADELQPALLARETEPTPTLSSESPASVGASHRVTVSQNSRRGRAVAKSVRCATWRFIGALLPCCKIAL